MDINIIDNLINKYGLKIGFKGFGSNAIKGIQSDITIDELDKIFIKNNKDEILQHLEELKYNKEAQSKKDYEANYLLELKLEYPNQFEMSEQENRDILLKKWEEPCNNPNEECNLDFVYLYVTPKGTIYTKRIHTH